MKEIFVASMRLGQHRLIQQIMTAFLYYQHIDTIYCVKDKEIDQYIVLFIL